MKILYDHQIFSRQNYGGISRYFKEISNLINSINNVKTFISLKIYTNYYIQKVNFLSIFFNKYNFRAKTKIIYLINRLYSIYILKFKEYHIFHPTYYDTYFLKYLGEKKFVLTVYDMIHEKCKDNFSIADQTSINKKTLIQKASKIISISESTKRDIIEIYGISESKIEVIYLGNSLKPSNQYIKYLPKKYILFVGSRDGYKNFSFLIFSLSRLLLKNKDLYLVCAGGGNFNSTELNLFSKFKIEAKLLQYNLDDECLANFYSQAELFVFPSIYEGFGIPILESFACNCPLVCSNTSSFPEIAGNAAVFFDPLDEKSILSSVEYVLNNKKVKNILRERGRARLNFFSWEKTASLTKKLYDSLLI